MSSGPTGLGEGNPGREHNKSKASPVRKRSTTAGRRGGKVRQPWDGKEGNRKDSEYLKPQQTERAARRWVSAICPRSANSYRQDERLPSALHPRPPDPGTLLTNHTPRSSILCPFRPTFKFSLTLPPPQVTAQFLSFTAKLLEECSNAIFTASWLDEAPPS